MSDPTGSNANSARATIFSMRLIVSLFVCAGLCGAIIYFVVRRSPNEPQSPEPNPAVIKPPEQPSPPDIFHDVTSTTEIAFVSRNGEEADQFTMLETLGSGVALIDFNNDGLLDVFLAGGGYFAGPDKTEIRGLPCRLYQNLGGFRFVDVTKSVGLERQWGYTHGVAVGDFDCDGWPDLAVTSYEGLIVLRNSSGPNGSRIFVDVTKQLGAVDNRWCTGAGWADLDGDGFPDLYVCHYVDWSFSNHPFCTGQSGNVPRDVCSPKIFKPLVHALFMNKSGKSLTNRAIELGFKAEGKGLGVIMVDLNDDQRPDVYVGNDTTNNFLFMNRGAGKLEEKGVDAGVAVDERGFPNGSMGVDAADYDGTGRPSLWVTNFEGEVNALYRNLGNELFDHGSRSTGIVSLGVLFVGFGTGFIDFDNDGWEDLVVTNGHVHRFPVIGKSTRQRPLLLQNIPNFGRRMFKDIGSSAGPYFRSEFKGRGLAIGDLDNDGWPDVVVSHTNSPVAILRNEAYKSNPHHWLGIKLVGKNHRDTVGSTVILEGNTRKLTRFAKGGGSYLSSNDRRLLFGLGTTEQIKRVTVKWSWGQTETWENLEPDAYWELHEGNKTPKRQFPSKK